MLKELLRTNVLFPVFNLFSSLFSRTNCVSETVVGVFFTPQIERIGRLVLEKSGLLFFLHCHWCLFSCLLV